MKKERHGFLTFWLISGLVLHIICLFIFTMALDSNTLLAEMEISRGTAIMYIVFMFAGVLINVLLLNWKMSGFILLCILSVAALFIDQSPSTIVWAIMAPALEFALFQLKKDGASAWSHLVGSQKLNQKNGKAGTET